jgi:hypothetical protein
MTASVEGAKGVTGVVVYRNQERSGGSGHGSGHCASFPPPVTFPESYVSAKFTVIWASNSIG